MVKLKEPLNLYGLVRKNEDLTYVISIGKKNKYLPIIGQVKSNELMPDDYDIFGCLKDSDVIFYYRDNEQWHRTEKAIIDLNDMYKRTPFAADLMDKLKKSAVAIFGIGSGGSRIAVGLARCGVGYFRLIDPDRFTIENVSRHECNLLDLDRFKVEAVKERILMVNPLAEVEIFSCDIFEQSEKIKGKVFTKADLVIASTDKKVVQLRINEECYRKSIPALFTGCYDEARAGEILYVIPGETTICYECLRGGTMQQKRQRKYDYSRARDNQTYEGEPGLNAAINLISDVAEQYAIALLLRKEDCEMAKLIDLKNTLLFIGGALGEGYEYLKKSRSFKKPFHFIKPNLKGPWKDCGTCLNKQTKTDY